MVAVIALVAWAIIGLPMIQQSPPYYYEQPAKAEHRDGPSSKPIAQATSAKDTEERKQEGHWYEIFSDHPTDWLLVLFNGILAAFTVRLFYAADEQSRDMKASVAVAQKAAESADLSAKAALRVEQPIITAAPPGLISISGRIPANRSYAGRTLVGVPTENCALREIVFRNYGSTPAILSSLHIGYSIAETKPPKPAYSLTVHFREGAIVLPDRTGFGVALDFDFRLDQAQLAELKAGAILWLWCLLTFDDFMDLRLGKEFAWQWGRYPEDVGRPDAYHFMALRTREEIDPDMLRTDYESAAD
jgi:hypothetical protein